MILVTGGAGFVGAELVDKLVEKGHRVKVLDWFLYEDFPFKREYRDYIELIKGDIRDDAIIREAMNGVESVIHLAAISNDPSADLDSKLTWEVNYEGTLKILNAASQSGVKRFINASSASVYGINEAKDVNENTVMNPITCYAETKCEAEKIVLAKNSANFMTVSIRPATLVGFSKRLRLDLVANIFTYQGMTKGEITILGGSQKRPLLAIEDMVDLYVRLLEADATIIGGQAFNVSEANYTVEQIATMVAELIDHPVGVITLPSNDNRSYHLNSNKLKAALNWKPEQGIYHSLENLIHNFANGNVAEPENDKYRNIKMMQAANVQGV